VETRSIVFLALIVLVSGCADNSGENEDLGTSSGNGLEIESLGVADDTLSPSQQTTLTLILKNYHTQEIKIDEISVFNDGQLILGDDGTETSQDKIADCDPEEIQKAQQGIAPEMECTWRITAPSEEELGAFDSKPMPVNVRIAYDSSIINSDPLKLQFRSVSEIDSTETITKTFSNGEVEVSMEVEQPASFSGKTMYFNVENSGEGNVEGGYEFTYNPESVFEDCADNHKEKDPVVGSNIDFSCQVQQDTESVRNLFTSVSYKYVKTPTIDIEVVSR
jgi:hypothetical protein